MQVTDIFYMNLDIAFGGMDQRHAHMLARDIAEKMGRKKVISIHGSLLGSLKGSGRMDTFKKMSKSDPDSAIFISDSREEVNRKLKGAFCPAGQVEGNPVMDLFRHVVFPYIDHEVTIHRPPKKGGELQVKSYNELESLYLKNEIHPMDLKSAAADSLNELIEPGRAVFR
jgi:tyrosyl-tRNA synthetase